MRAKDVLGRRGEQLAVDHLRRCGIVVLDRNWRCADGELDIVAREGATLVFCEVKTRSGTRYGLPAEAVIPAKAQRIRRLAVRWLSVAGRSWPEIRFDVVSVLDRAGGEPDVQHIRGAF